MFGRDEKYRKHKPTLPAPGSYSASKKESYSYTIGSRTNKNIPKNLPGPGAYSL
jgi:hypothetical protein